MSSSASQAISGMRRMGRGVSGSVSGRPDLPTRFTTTRAVARPDSASAAAESSSASRAANSAGSATTTSAEASGSARSRSRSAAIRRSGPAGVVARIARGIFTSESAWPVAGASRTMRSYAGGFPRAFRPLEELADLAEEEEVGQARRGTREVAEGRGGEDPVRDDGQRRDRPDEIRKKGVELRRQAVERRGELGFEVAPVGLSEERGRVSAAAFRDEEDAPPLPCREGGESRRDRRLADAPLSRDHEEPPVEEPARKDPVVAHVQTIRWKCPAERRWRSHFGWKGRTIGRRSRTSRRSPSTTRIRPLAAASGTFSLPWK